MSFIEFNDVKKKYRMGDVTIEALSGASFNIEKGEFVVIAGPSGAGKSTILNLLGGMDSVSSGEIVVDGQKVSSYNSKELTTYRRYDIGFVFQFYNLVQNLTVKENVEMATQICKHPLDIEQTIEAVGLKERMNNFPAQLSGGEQQRVAIARAIVNQPKVLLLDESLSALDKRLRKDMQFELREIQKKLGITFIFVTHDQEEALAMSDEIFVLNEGKIQQSGSPVDIYDEPANDFVARFIGDSNILSGRMIKDYEVEFGNHRFECADAGIKPGEKVEVVLRPEDLDITDIEHGKLRVVVESQLFLGDHFEIKAIDSDENEWLIHSTNPTKIGKEVGVYFDPEDIHVMRFGESEAEFDKRLEAYEGEE